ncbi:MAG: hypothetical protein AAF721_29055 [Myxococcota bacterium]
MNAPDEPYRGSQSPRSEAPLPGNARWFGLILAAAAFAPLLRDGTSFFDLVVLAFGRSALEGVLWIVGLGSPFLFGLAVAAAVHLPPHVGARLVRVPIALLHGQLILVIWAIWSGGQGVATLPMLGFSIVSAVAFAVQLASGRASTGGSPSLRWHIQWGGMMIMAIILWCRLQLFAGIYFGWAPTVMLGATILLRRATQPPQPEPDADD